MLPIRFVYRCLCLYTSSQVQNGFEKARILFLWPFAILNNNIGSTFLTLSLHAVYNEAAHVYGQTVLYSWVQTFHVRNGG